MYYKITGKDSSYGCSIHYFGFNLDFKIEFDAFNYICNNQAKELSMIIKFFSY